jgi:hypothetical protein
MMKKSSGTIFVLLVLVIVSIYIAACKKSNNPIKFTQGAFPDTVTNLTGLNSAFDDYNSNIYLLGNNMQIIFSSNRNSNGGQFDFVQGTISYQFDQTTGAFSLTSAMSNDAFYSALITKANTTGNDFGPYSIHSSTDGYEYLLTTSQNGPGQLDIYYMKYLPNFGTVIPDISGPFPAKILNSSSDDAYISFDLNADSAYFSSNRNGNFDIYLQKRPLYSTLDSWLKQDFAPSSLVDSVNSGYEDKCPFVYKNIMLFASNRPGGAGGYDLYYSVFKKGNWSSPVNMGPKINSASDEFRPVLGYNQDFTNMFIVFSSNRPDGKGGYDLYFTGINIQY